MTRNFEIGLKVKFTNDAINNMSNPELIDLNEIYEVVCLSPLKVEDVYGNRQRVPRKDYKYLINNPA